MGAPALKRYVVFTRTSRIIGVAEDKLLLGLNTGCTMDNARIGLPQFLSFYGRPHGDLVAVRDFMRIDEINFKVIMDKLFASYMVPKDEIIMLNDLSTMRLSGHSPEKAQVEKNFMLENVFVKIPDYGIIIKGQTYLSKIALDNGIIRPSLKDGEWFLLQYPEFVGETGQSFDQMVELSAIGTKLGFDIDHLMININKVSVGT